jgi:hypothetical protein
MMKKTHVINQNCDIQSLITMKFFLNPHFNGAKCVVLVPRTTCYAWMDVMTLIMDETWKKPIEHFCGLVRKTICYVWMGMHV